MNRPERWQAAESTSTDLRGSMSLVLAALLAPGESRVHRAQMALRGYNRLEDKLRGLGLQVEREPQAAVV